MIFLLRVFGGGGDGVAMLISCLIRTMGMKLSPSDAINATEIKQGNYLFIEVLIIIIILYPYITFEKDKIVVRVCSV